MLARAAERAAGNPQFLRDLLAAAAAGDDALTETLEAAATAGSTGSTRATGRWSATPRCSA